jgi:hypothetical protein
MGVDMRYTNCSVSFENFDGLQMLSFHITVNKVRMPTRCLSRELVRIGYDTGFGIFKTKTETARQVFAFHLSHSRLQQTIFRKPTTSHFSPGRS